MKTKTALKYHYEANMLIIKTRDNQEWEFVEKGECLCTVIV